MRMLAAAVCCVVALLLVDQVLYQGHYRDRFSGMLQRISHATFR